MVHKNNDTERTRLPKILLVCFVTRHRHLLIYPRQTRFRKSQRAWHSSTSFSNIIPKRVQCTHIFLPCSLPSHLRRPRATRTRSPSQALFSILCTWTDYQNASKISSHLGR